MKPGTYVAGKWIEGDGEGQSLYNAVTGELITAATTKGIDFEAVLKYGRTFGSQACCGTGFAQYAHCCYKCLSTRCPGKY